MRHLILAALVAHTSAASAAPTTTSDDQMSISVEVVPTCGIRAPSADQAVDAHQLVTWSWRCGSTSGAAHVQVDGAAVRQSTDGQLTLAAGASNAIAVRLDL